MQIAKERDEMAAMLQQVIAFIRLHTLIFFIFMQSLSERNQYAKAVFKSRCR